MDLGLKGKVALLTGASRGLGFAAAEALAKKAWILPSTAEMKSNYQKPGINWQNMAHG